MFNYERNRIDMQKKKSMKGGKHFEENREVKNLKGKIWKEGNTFPPMA
jgi:hypothetical protein